MREEFTATEVKILERLSDGEPHSAKELRELIGLDNLDGREWLQMHISRIRKKLKPKGHYIVGEWSHRKCLYRHVRLLASAVDGYQ